VAVSGVGIHRSKARDREVVARPTGDNSGFWNSAKCCHRQIDGDRSFPESILSAGTLARVKPQEYNVSVYNCTDRLF